jgi:hypothetical protein
VCANLPQDNGKVARREVAQNAISARQAFSMKEIFVLIRMLSAHPVVNLAREKAIALFA